MERYRPIKQIGKGSFGNALLVQPANQPSKNLVMKIIDISKLDRKQKEEAVNEVHVLKALRHPYVVAYRESFVEKQCLCIVMDYADGGDLQSQINKQKQKGGFFREEQILNWFVQICLALKHIHDRQILHRDIKAQNIFLTSKNGVKLGDFGIARVLRNQEDYARTAIGTPYYLSPEICDGRPYNQKSDIWSLGCILYQMITLKHAFDGNTIKGLMKKIMTEQYTPIPSSFSSELAELVSEMLTKDPNQRPTINEVLQKRLLNKQISSFLQEAVTPLTPKSSGLEVRSSSAKKTLFKNSSERELHSKRNDSYSLYKASFHKPEEAYFSSPRLPTKSQPVQSQENFEGLTQSQVEHSDYFPDIASIPYIKTNARSKPIFSLQIKSPNHINRPSMTPRTNKNSGQEERSKNHLKDRPKSYEKYYLKSPGIARPTIDTTYYSSVHEINNVITENLSFINNIKVTPQVQGSFLSQDCKQSPSYKFEDQRRIISSMLSPREDNQTPEGDLMDLMQILADNDVKKEIGHTDLGIKGKAVSEPCPASISVKRLEKMTKGLSRAGDENALEFEGMWTLLEEKLGTYQLEKAYCYMKTNRGKEEDVRSLVKIIGEKNEKHVKDLEKLVSLRKRDEEC